MRQLLLQGMLLGFIKTIKQKINASMLVSALTVLLVAFVFNVNSQCTIIPNATPAVTLGFVQNGGTNSSGVAYNPNFNIYYAGIAGNPGFPLETFTAAGVPLYQTNTGFDIRGLWWNANQNRLEANGFNAFGVWTFNLNGVGHALNTGTSVYTGNLQPTTQSVGDYNCVDNEIWYYNGSGAIQKRNPSTGALISTLVLTGMPVGTGNLNYNSVFYTDCLGHEIGLLDYQLKRIYFFDKVTGAYSGMSQLPGTTITNNAFRASWANGLVFLYNVGTRTWYGFQVLTGFNTNCTVVACTPPTLVTDDLVGCAPNTVDLNSGINAASDPGNATFYATLANANAGISPISNIVSVSGTYYVRYEDPTDATCFSVDTIVVTINPNYNLIENVDACENSTVTYPDGTTATITASTSYTSNLTTVASCDSIIVTNVTMIPDVTIVSNINACENSTVTYPDGSTATITANTSYTSNLTSAAGCDSIIVTNVTMIPDINVVSNITACENSTVTYPDGSTAVITGNTSQTSNLTSSAGCDSVIVTNVTMDPTINTVSNVVACENSTVTYPDGSTAVITGNTSQTSTLTSASGCDSVIVTNVTMTTTINTVSNIDACENSTVTYPDGSTAIITGNTSQTSNLTSASGCDSIVVTNVTMVATYNAVSNIIACENSIVTYPDGTSATITANTSYTSNLTSAVGCDSIIVTNVTMSPIFNSVSNIFACENSTVTYPDGSTEVITASTSHTSNLTTTAGCDSIIVTNVTISFSSTSTVNETVCFGDQYTSPQGNTYGAGSFVETLLSATGCDSVVTYVVTESPLISTTTNENICYGEQYISASGVSYGGGTYVETFTSASGCDSVVTLNVFEGSPVNASFFVDEENLTTLNTDVTFVNTSDGANSFIWAFGDGLSGSFEESPTHSYPSFEATSYTVTLIAINQAGCADTLIRPIVFQEELIYFIPNTFTPDGDEHNQIFQPVFSSGYDPYDFSLLIFNRWGQVIFESHDPSMGWDGTYNGKYVQDGTYNWKLEFKLISSDERMVDTGHINMIR